MRSSLGLDEQFRRHHIEQVIGVLSDLHLAGQIRTDGRFGIADVVRLDWFIGVGHGGLLMLLWHARAT